MACWLPAVDPVATPFGTVCIALQAFDAPQVARYLRFVPTGCKYSMRTKSMSNKTEARQLLLCFSR